MKKQWKNSHSCDSLPEMSTIHAQTPMGEILQQFPGARRALFARYHIGGCSSCAYQDAESLLGVCERNQIDVEEVIEHILQSHEVEKSMLISAADAKALLETGSQVSLLDTRTREEHEAVTIEGAEFLTQELQQKLFAEAGEETAIILFDHTGGRVLDTCAWFVGHGLKNTKGIIGGIDAWSREVDKSVPRYKLEMD